MLDWDDIAKRSAAEPRSELDLVQVMRRGRVLGRQRFITLAAVGILVVGLGTTAVARLPFGDGNALPPADRQAPDQQESPPADQEPGRDWHETGDGPFVTGGYRFSDIEVRLAPQLDPSSSLDRAVIRFDLEWASDSYPGTRTCTWDVFDEQGHKIGSATSSFSATSRRYRDPVIKDRVDVSGEPRHVEISCDDERLDNPEGHFEISDITVEQTAQSASQYRVGFRYRWEGGGLPVPQRCEVIAYSEDGSVVHRSTQLFDAMGTGPNRTFFYADVDPGEEPADATVECAADPF